jgi:hypothetical protein
MGTFNKTWNELNEYAHIMLNIIQTFSMFPHFVFMSTKFPSHKNI